MLKQKLFTVLKYTFGVLTASLMLALLDLTQAPNQNWESILTNSFWFKLFGLFFIYLFGSYVLVFYGDKIKIKMLEG